MWFSSHIFRNSAPLVLVRKLATCVSYQEVRIPVPWGHIAGKWWGPTDSRPVLAVHGWQDNCGTYNRLIPLLNPDTGYLAIDLPGHGFSSRIPSGVFSTSTQYLILLHYLVDYLQWSKVSLIGHSLGGITSFIYTMLNPDKVDMLMCIDGSKPMVIKTPMPRLSRHIHNFQRYAQHEMSKTEPPSYSLEEIQQRIHAPNNNSVELPHTLHLAERNIAPSQIHPGKYYFTRDPRLKAPEFMSFPQEELVEGAKLVKCPTFICKAKGAPVYEPPEYLKQVMDVLEENNQNFHYHLMEGTHHIHLNNPEELASKLNEFMNKYNVEDRGNGALNENLVEITN